MYKLCILCSFILIKSWSTCVIATTCVNILKMRIKIKFWNVNCLFINTWRVFRLLINNAFDICTLQNRILRGKIIFWEIMMIKPYLKCHQRNKILWKHKKMCIPGIHTSKCIRITRLSYKTLQYRIHKCIKYLKQ